MKIIKIMKIMKIKKWFGTSPIFNIIPRIHCVIFGHDVVPMLTEDNWGIYTRGCSRCKQHVMFPSTWKGCPSPPNSTTEEVKQFEEWKKKHYQDIRDSVNVAS